MKNVLLIGAGRFGSHVASQLTLMGHDVLVVDKREERVDRILSIVTDAQIGDSTSEEFLASLGVRDFDLCIVAIGDDFLNSLETTSLLHELGAPLVVARACSDRQEKFLLRNGADAVVYPERVTARWCAMRFGSDNILNFTELDDDHAIVEVNVPRDWVGRTVGDLHIRARYGLNLLGIKERGRLNMSVAASTVLRANQTLLALGTHEAVHRCFRT